MSTVALSVLPVHQVRPIECKDCPLGRVAGVGAGQFCPLVTRDEPPGAVLARAGEPAERLWFVKAGVIGTRGGRDDQPADAVDRVYLPGSFVGLESLVGDRYEETARVLARAQLCSATLSGLREWSKQSTERLAFLGNASLAREAAR